VYTSSDIGFETKFVKIRSGIPVFKHADIHCGLADMTTAFCTVGTQRAWKVKGKGKVIPSQARCGPEGG